jgi:hypothetical protein
MLQTALENACAAVLKDKLLELQHEMNTQHLQDTAKLREANLTLNSVLEFTQSELDASRSLHSNLQATMNNNTSEVASKDAEICELNKKLANILGHHNPKQRIHHVEKLKEELSAAKRETQKLQKEVEKYKTMSFGDNNKVNRKRELSCFDKENRQM